MNETTTSAENAAAEPKRKRGRPKNEDVVLYREGGRIRAWNPRLEAKVNTPPRLPSGVRVYDGLGCDWVAWGQPLTRDGDYNTATRSPFRKAPEEGKALIPALDEYFKADENAWTLLNAISSLYIGAWRHFGNGPLILSGSYWVRFFSALFVREAGVDGINRSNRQPIAGKVWASVNVLPSQGAGYNYTEEAWYSVVNAVRAPLFCVKVEGAEYLKGSAIVPPVLWSPEQFAAAVLASLEACEGKNSCEALAEPVTEEEKPSPPTETEPQAVAAAPEPAATCEDTSAEPTPEKTQETPVSAPASKTWGEYLDTPFATKGLTSSKDLGMPTKLSRILEMVTNHDVTRRLTEECRKHTKVYLETGDKKPLNEYKRDNLHVWYAAPTFAERFKGSVKSNISGYTGLACLDFDGFKSEDDAAEVRDTLFLEFPEVLFSAVSASGLGVMAVVGLDFDGTEEGYRGALEAAFQLFEAKGYMPDTGCCDPTRARYISADAEALSRPPEWKIRPISASGEGYIVIPATMLRNCWTNSGRRKKGIGYEYLKEHLRRIENAPDGMKDTTMTSVMGSAARLIREYDLNADKVYDSIRAKGRECGYDEKKTEDKIRRLGVSNLKKGGVK